MKDPKISLNKLGEYMTAPAGRRRRIIEEQINPSDFIVARYTDARESICDYLAGNIDDQALEQIAQNLRQTQYDSKFTAQDKNLSANAIDDFLEVADQFPEHYKFEKVPASDTSILNMGGLEISIRPDLYIKNDNEEVVGAIKLHFPKTNPLTTTAGEYVTTALKTFLQENIEPGIDNKLCIVVDVPSGAVIHAPKASKKRLADLEAACEEIRNQWTAKSN